MIQISFVGAVMGADGTIISYTNGEYTQSELVSVL